MHNPNLPPELLANIAVQTCAPVEGGHMLYGKYLITTEAADDLFVKVSDPTLLTDDVQAGRMWEYLVKEQLVYDVLERHGYAYIPNASLHGTALAIEALRPDEDWFWEAPVDSQEYTDEVLHALGVLATIPAADELANFEHERAMDNLFDDGWAMLARKSNARVLKRQHKFGPEIHDHVRGGLDILERILQPEAMAAQAEESEAYAAQTHDTIAHFDARQPNIAWHPNKGVRLVDMSWVDGGPPLADSTMFLIDLHKSGRIIEPYLDTRFDAQHARLLVGYWLGRCILPTRTGDLTVRFHQFASAVSAVDLLLRRGQLFAGE